MFGAGGGTSSYREIEDTDLIILWGSNARETHPIFFHHVLKGVRKGARLYAIDPRRTSSAAWADVWLGLDVGSDIALANAIGREIIAAGLCNREFIERATTGFDAYRRSVEPYTLEHAARITGVAAEMIRELAHAYARADRAQVCWTLGITEHHNAGDNVFAIINLALLTGHVGRYGSGLVPLRGQNNVQGGGDMGAIPNKFVGGQDVENAEQPREVRARIRQKPSGEARLAPEPDVRGDGARHAAGAVHHRRESRAVRGGRDTARCACSRGVDHIIVQDIFLTKTAELAHVVLPAAAAWCESEGTVTSSERRVQRVRKALNPPGDARDDISILCDLASRLGHDWGKPTAEDVWNEIRRLSPWHGGMSYRRLEALDGLQWPCPDGRSSGQPAAARPAVERSDRRGAGAVHAGRIRAAGRHAVADFPMRLTTGRRLDSFNTGVQTGGYSSPLRFGETIDLAPEDGVSLGVAEGERVRIVSRRGAVDAPVRFDRGLRPGLAFMTMHFPDEVDTNMLTIDAVDPKSGTAEFKASAVRIERL